jgi:hypothetical protein
MYIYINIYTILYKFKWGRHRRDCMIVGFMEGYLFITTNNSHQEYRGRHDC